MSDDAPLTQRPAPQFDSSAVGAALDYLRMRSRENLEKLVSRPASILAYHHHAWSSQGPSGTIEEFWRKNLAELQWSKDYENRVRAVQDYLEKQENGRWLDEVSRYLPRGHVLSGTIYLAIGYDQIAFKDDVLLNLSFVQFHADHREAVYYLIHELSHAGYYAYHPMPTLYSVRTHGELAGVVKCLTHLEGMGVFSSLRLRLAEEGLLDEDYKVLMDERETGERVDEYFQLLSGFEALPRKKVNSDDFRIYNEMSSRKKRLSYIAGGSMAWRIQAHYGNETLRELVREGYEAFFEKYDAAKN